MKFFNYCTINEHEYTLPAWFSLINVKNNDQVIARKLIIRGVSKPNMKYLDATTFEEKIGTCRKVYIFSYRPPIYIRTNKMINRRFYFNWLYAPVL